MGLLSGRLHGMVEAIPSTETTGTLELVRRCDTETCEGHCTCSPQGQMCDVMEPCTDVTGQATYNKH